MHKLLSSIFFGVWAIEPEHAQVFLPDVQRLLEGNAKALPKTELESYRAEHMPTLLNAAGDTEEAGTVSPNPEPRDLVMVMPVRGPILRNDVYCGPIGTETRAKWLKAADSDPNIIGVVLDMDTPGGEGAGMEVMCKALANMKKPVLCYVNTGMAASAGYGIAARCKEIMISGPGDALGSIGTYMTIADFRKHFAEYFKLPIHQVYATASTQKNRPFLEALKADPNDPADKNYELLRKELLDPFNEQFIAMVKEARPQLKDQDGVFNGRLVLGNEALRLGMADSTGTLDDAVQRVRTLAKPAKNTNAGAQNSAQPTSTTSATKPDSTMSFKAQLSTALAGFATLFATKEDRTNEAIAAVNAQLAADGIDDVKLATTAELALVANAQGLVAAAEENATLATAAATAAQTELAAARKEIETLKGQPAAPATTATTEAGGDADPATTTVETAVEDLPFNKAAREALANR